MKVARYALLALIGVILSAAISHQAHAAPPIWKRADVFNQAGQFCLYNKGVDNIRPNSAGNYWLTCSDGTMVRIRIKVIRSTATVAKL